jgi:hypothetical protein
VAGEREPLTATYCRIERSGIWHAGRMRILLVHSPLVGPSTWAPVAAVLAAVGQEVSVPDLRAAAKSGDPYMFIDAARAHVSADTAVIAGHSGAGFFLPSIATGSLTSPQLLFVDAGIPPTRGSATPGGDFIDRLRLLSGDGILPRWSTWWGEGVMERLVPDSLVRARIEAELVEVPLEFYEHSVDLPDWRRTAPSRYVLLSEGYRAEATTAISWGWPTRELLGAHLDLVNRPEVIARSMLELCATAY